MLVLASFGLAATEERSTSGIPSGIPATSASKVTEHTDEKNSPSPFTAEQRLDIAVHTRSLFGFRSDQSYVAELLADDADSISTRSYNFPMSQSEREELELRMSFADSQAAIERYVGDRYPGVLAGTYVDHINGGTLVVLLTNPDVVGVNELDQFVSRPGRLVIREAEFPLELLQRMYRELSSEHQSLRGAGMVPTSYGIDRIANRIAGHVPAARDLASTEQVIRSRLVTKGFSEDEVRAVSLIVAPMDRPNAVIWGGEPITSCSSGIQLIMPSTPWGPLHFTSESAHCGNSQSHCYGGCHGGALPWNGDETPNYSDADAQVHFTGSHSGDSAGIITDSSYGALFVTSEASIFGSHDSVGSSVVCRHGKVTASSCAYIAYLEYTADYGDWVFHNQRLAGYASDDGDSGGAVNGFVLYSLNVPSAGNHSGRSGINYGIYSFIANVRWDLAGTAPGLQTRLYGQ